MCKAIEDMKEEAREEGREEGRKEMCKAIEDMKEEAREEGRKEIILNLYVKRIITEMDAVNALGVNKEIFRGMIDDFDMDE